MGFDSLRKSEWTFCVDLLWDIFGNCNSKAICCDMHFWVFQKTSFALMYFRFISKILIRNLLDSINILQMRVLFDFSSLRQKVEDTPINPGVVIKVAWFIHSE